MQIRKPQQWWTCRRNQEKRDLVDGIGGALNFLFGTATDDEIKDVQNIVKGFAESQGEVIQRLNEFIVIVNHTYDEVQANRDQIMLFVTDNKNLLEKIMWTLVTSLTLPIFLLCDMKLICWYSISKQLSVIFSQPIMHGFIVKKA